MKISHQNLGTVNTNSVRLVKEGKDAHASLVLTFSYETCVMFDYHAGSNGSTFEEGYWSENERAVHQNDWSTTTGKLLNKLEADKTRRVPSEVFEKRLAEVLSKFEAIKE